MPVLTHEKDGCLQLCRGYIYLLDGDLHTPRVIRSNGTGSMLKPESQAPIDLQWLRPHLIEGRFPSLAGLISCRQIKFTSLSLRSTRMMPQRKIKVTDFLFRL